MSELATLWLRTFQKVVDKAAHEIKDSLKDNLIRLAEREVRVQRAVKDLQDALAASRQVANQLADLPGGLDRGYGSISNTVEISVVHDDGSIQAWADEEFGPGVVTVTSALEPVE